MSDLKIGSIPVLNTNKCIDILSNMYIKAVSNNCLNKIPSVMLFGPPGIGKSQSINEIARRIELNTNKKVNVTDVRLILFNPIDLRGIPTANENKTLAVWLKPKIFDMDDGSDVVNILFLDEITAAPTSVQAAAYQITLDKKIGEHKLPDNCIVIAAGNRVTDRSVAYQMPKALANRFLHLEIKSDFDSWNQWAIRSGINPKVLAFLKFRPKYLNNFDPQDANIAFATPRSWEMVSNILNNVSDDIKSVFELISGLVGVGVATEFRGWSKAFGDLPSIEGIFDGTEKRVPKDTDTIYALTSSMVYYAKTHKDDIAKITNSIKYAMNLAPDFSLILLKDYLYIDKDYKLTLLRIPEYKKWLETKGRLLDAAYRG